LTADEDNEDGVSILKVNTNCVLLMDSDKKSEKDDINNTKKRIRSEIESVNGLVWLTGGNEVENYIPSDALKEYFERDDLQDLGLFEEFADYLDYVEKGQGKKFLRNKVYFSEKIVPLITLNMVQSNGELIGNINKLCDRIKAWNKII
jgi:hypothetical protein